MPEQLETQILPLLPLTSGVVLPGMVVTLTLETDEAQRAAEAARSHDDQLLLVPRVANRYATVGTVAVIEDVGRLRNGMEALVIRGLHRAVVGTGVAGTGDATWVTVSDAVEVNAETERARELAREYRAAPTCLATRPNSPSSRRWRSSRPWTWSAAWTWWSGGPRRPWPRSS